MFGENGMNRVCGHAEVEMGLVELARSTGEERYLEAARALIERRGRGTIPLHEFGRAFWQDDVPIREATVLRGHAVRALYLSAGACDVAVETGDEDLLDALRRQWDATVERRTYITGGMGSHHMDEAFGEDFVLPPDRSYCETYAGVAAIMLSWRLLLATGEARYADLIERVLYNVVATSPSADGRSFFYANTLHQRSAGGEPAMNDDGVAVRGGASGRQSWFEVSCCPPNLARTLESLAAYVVTDTADTIHVHQLMAGEFRTSHGVLRIDTDYPRTGRVVIDHSGCPGAHVAVRIPSWADGAALLAGDRSVPAWPGGYALVEGEEPVIVLELPMEPRLTAPDPRVDAVRGCVAVELGPEVLALESTDLLAGWSLDEARLVRGARPVLDGDEVRIAMRRLDLETPGCAHRSAGTAASTAAPAVPGNDRESAEVRLVRYHDWGERGASTMRIWIPVVEV